ncbi:MULTISPECIES: hypothetical protein [Shewanella]|uniref:Adhesin domain-containing protein n=2 Tax=Shewanella TaxID=22 RepID=A0AAJ1BIZ5_9GAMM|nr:MULTISPECIES: hypothetical protein [Shewanella]AZQ11393.1 hypothetical protein STH12_02307 [Shewanella khirikhana]MCH4295635.1 hypothetical protein [Shewanella zhuhaiensis]
MRTALTTATLTALLLAVPAFAADKTLTQSFDYQGETLTLDVGVGEVEIVAADTQQVQIEVRVEPSNDGFLFFGGRKDVSDVDLHAKLTEGKKLTLRLNDNDDVKEHWRISIPASAAINVDMGVGRIETNGLDNSVEIDLGVGEVEVNHSHDYGDISLHSGVGDVSFSHNGQNVEVERAMVSASYQANAGGQGRLAVDVGVGEVDINKL